MTVVMRRCDACKLMFHKPKGQGTLGCQCLGHDCGCQILNGYSHEDYHRDRRRLEKQS